MKSALLALAWLTGWIALCLAMSGCVTTTTTSAVDVHEAHSKSVDSNEMRFRELQAISPEEIANRWKP